MDREQLIKHLYTKQKQHDNYVNLGEYPTDETERLKGILKSLKNEGMVEYKIPYQGTFVIKNTNYFDGSKSRQKASIPAQKGNLEARLTLAGKRYYSEKKGKFNPTWIVIIIATVSAIIAAITLYKNFF